MPLLSGSTYAASFGAIGVSFLGDTDINNNGGGGDTSGWVLAPADIAGVAPQANWNNISTPGWGSGAPTGATNSGPLADYAGNLTAVVLQLVAGDAWNSSYTPGLSVVANSGPTNNPNEKLMKGVIKQGNQPAMTFTFTNLPNDTYEIYVYGAVDSGAGNLDTSIDATTNYWTEPEFFTDPPGFINATSTDPSVRAAGNYVHFTGVTPAVDGTNYYITITVNDARQRGWRGHSGVADFLLEWLYQSSAGSHHPPAPARDCRCGLAGYLRCGGVRSVPDFPVVLEQRCHPRGDWRQLQHATGNRR